MRTYRIKLGLLDLNGRTCGLVTTTVQARTLAEAERLAIERTLRSNIAFSNAIPLLCKEIKSNN